MTKSSYILICLVLALGLGVSPATAQQENSVALLADGQYFSVYADGPVDAYSISSKLNFDYLVLGDSLTRGASEDQKQILVKTIDGLYLEVSDILDIHMRSFKGIIRVLPDKQYLADFVKKTFDRDFNERSLYFFEKNTIFISQADLTLGMLGYEIAHAIISNFFAVLPPPKVQEILCGYVEYCLNKTHGS
jgi:hypothetical protein